MQCDSNAKDINYFEYKNNDSTDVKFKEDCE